MSSTWQEARTCLDDSLVLPFETCEKLKAAGTIELKEVINQLKLAAESAEKLRSFVSAELPNSSWRSRQELDSLCETMDKEIQARLLRYKLLDLITELERGRVVHRRTARVEQVNQFRDAAIKELQVKAAVRGRPAPLPGPEATQWVDWACGLEEPGDVESLKILRSSFPCLDDFVSHLEPGMWQVEATPEVSSPKPARAKIEEVHKNLRERLLSLASELERGSIVHHRAVRVTQLNQLRAEAVKELRRQAKAAGAPDPLPGPKADQWIEWACSLKEPDDAEAVESIREGFTRLDDFIAHLEPNMWFPCSSEPEVSAASSDDTPSGPPVVSGSVLAPPPPNPSAAGRTPAVSKTELPRQPQMLLDEEDEENGFGGWLRQKKEVVTQRMNAAKYQAKSADVQTAGKDKASSSKLQDLIKSKRSAVILAIAVVVIAALGTIGWRSHRTRLNNVVRAEAPIPANPGNTTADSNSSGTVTSQEVGVTQADSIVHAGGTPIAQPASSASKPQTPDTSKPKAESAPAQSASAKPSQMEDMQLRTPTAIPKAGGSNGTAPASAEKGPDLLALAGSPTGSKVISDVVSVPVAKPRFSGDISGGVTAGALVQQVNPAYPSQARQAHVEGTVVLDAVIGKDGSVRSVKVVSGHPLLTQAAVDAVKKWRYKPSYLNGEAVEAKTQVKIRFAP